MIAAKLYLVLIYGHIDLYIDDYMISLMTGSRSIFYLLINLMVKG